MICASSSSGIPSVRSLGDVRLVDVVLGLVWEWVLGKFHLHYLGKVINMGVLRLNK